MSEVRNATTCAIDTLLRLKMAHDLVEYVVDEKREKWRDLVSELHVNYPIKATGVVASLETLDSTDVDAEDGGFMRWRVDVTPDDIVSELGEHPFDAASAAYAFSIVEVFGNEVANLRNPEGVRAKGSWHETIKYDIEAADREKGIAAMRAFARVFGGDFLCVKPASIVRLMALKAARNDYIHRRQTNIDFDAFIAFCVAIVCQIYFLCEPDGEALRHVPWSTYDDIWQAS